NGIWATLEVFNCARAKYRQKIDAAQAAQIEFACSIHSGTGSANAGLTRQNDFMETLTLAPERRTTGALGETPLLNRELSWIEFNSRVLDEALDPSQPLLERLKFLSIFSTNLDEFFMVRVSGLQEQLDANPLLLSPDGLSAATQLKLITERLRPLLEVQMRCLLKQILPGL